MNITNFLTYNRRHSGLQIGINFFCHDSENNPEMHEHLDFYEFVIVESGCAVHSHNGRDSLVGPGSVFIIVPGERHCYKSPNELCIYNLLLKQEFMESFFHDLTGLPGFQLLFGHQPAVIRQEFFYELIRDIARLHKISGGREAGYRTAMIANFLTVLHKMCSSALVPTTENSSKVSRISDVITFMKNSYNKSHSLESLARRAGMSISGFQQKFRQLMGTSPMNYLLLLRLESAAELLLLPGDLSIADIAERTGFYDGNYFARCFKKQFGMTPTRYRKFPR